MQAKEMEATIKVSTAGTASKKEFSYRKQWSDESMVSAINIAKGGMSVNWAATLYNFTRSCEVASQTQGKTRAEFLFDLC